MDAQFKYKRICPFMLPDQNVSWTTSFPIGVSVVSSQGSLAVGQG